MEVLNHHIGIQVMSLKKYVPHLLEDIYMYGQVNKHQELVLAQDFHQFASDLEKFLEEM